MFALNNLRFNIQMFFAQLRVTQDRVVAVLNYRGRVLIVLTVARTYVFVFMCFRTIVSIVMSSSLVLGCKAIAHYLSC